MEKYTDGKTLIADLVKKYKDEIDAKVQNGANWAQAVYRLACRQFHPDLGTGQSNIDWRCEMMKLVNVWYETAKTAPQPTAPEMAKTELDSIREELREVVAKARRYPGVKLEATGAWLWAWGVKPTDPAAEYFKSIGFSWHTQKFVFVYAGVPAWGHIRSMRTIRRVHGSQEIANQIDPAVA